MADAGVPRAARISATIWRFHSKRHFTARPHRSVCQLLIGCEACAGSGAKPGAKPRHCPTCGGHGRVRAQQGFFAIERTCPHCHGGGEIIDDPCQSCGGSGRVTKQRSLSVNIPPGVEDGTRIRLGGEGEAGAKGGPCRRSLHFRVDEAASIFSARGRRSLLPRSNLYGPGGARRRSERPYARGRRSKGQNPGGNSIRQTVQTEKQGDASAADRAKPATFTSK